MEWSSVFVLLSKKTLYFEDRNEEFIFFCYLLKVHRRLYFDIDVIIEII